MPPLTLTTTFRQLYINDEDDDWDNEDGFVGYVADTVDPGWGLLAVTLFLCVSSLVCIPFLLVLGSRYEERRKREWMLQQKHQQTGRRCHCSRLFCFIPSRMRASTADEKFADEIELARTKTDDSGCTSHDEGGSANNPYKCSNTPASSGNGVVEMKGTRISESCLPTNNETCATGSRSGALENGYDVNDFSGTHGKSGPGKGKGFFGNIVDNSDGDSVFDGLRRVLDTIAIPPYPDDSARSAHDSCDSSQSGASPITKCSAASFIEATMASKPLGVGPRSKPRRLAPIHRTRKLERDIKNEARFSIQCALENAETRERDIALSRKHDESGFSINEEKHFRSLATIKSGQMVEDLSLMPAKIPANGKSFDDDKITYPSADLEHDQKNSSMPPLVSFVNVETFAPHQDTGDYEKRMLNSGRGKNVLSVSHELVSKDNDNDELDLCCGKNALWRPKAVKHAFSFLLDLINLDKESNRIIKLAAPFLFSEVMETVFEAIIVALIAKHLGTDAVAAVAIVDVLVGMSEELIGGIIDAQYPLSSHALGMGNNYLVGQYVQMSMVFFTLANIPVFLLWCFLVKPAILWFGFSEHVANIGQAYARVELIHEWQDGLTECIHALYEVTEHELFSTFIGVAEGFFETLSVFLVLIYVDGVQLYHLAIIFIIVGSFFSVVSVLLPWRWGWLRPFIPGMLQNISLKNRKAFWNLLRTAAPLSFGELLAYGEWEILTIFCAYLGPAEVATWTILSYVWEVFEATTEGIGDASEVRVGYHLGKGRPEMAKVAAYKCILLAMIFSLFVTSVFFIIGDDFPRLMTNDPAIQHMMIQLIPFVGIGNLTMTFGTVSWAVIGAQGRYPLATKVATFSSWTVTIPLASIFVYGFYFDLRGVTAAITIGDSFCGMVLSYILLRSDWKRLSKIIQEENAITGAVDSSDDEDDRRSSSLESLNSSISSSSCSSGSSSSSSVSSSSSSSGSSHRKSSSDGSTTRDNACNKSNDGRL